MKAGKNKRNPIVLLSFSGRGNSNAFAISAKSALMQTVDTHYMKLIPKKAERINQRSR